MRGIVSVTPIISVICVTYKQSGPLKVFVNSFLNQTAPNWKLLVYHDGPDADFDSLMNGFCAHGETRIAFKSTTARFNDFGHSLREMALAEVDGDYVLLTNGDNYYVPIFVAVMTESIRRFDPDVVMFDMIHSHNCPGGRPQLPYSFFRTEYRRKSIDMGSAIVRTNLAKQAGFRDKSHDGDATYFEDVAKLRGPNLKIVKANQVLFVHN